MAKKATVIDGIDLTITSPALYIVTIKGMDGILFNKIPDLSIPKSKSKKQTQEDRLAYEKEHWKEKAYFDAQGGLFVPGENIHECLKEGCAYWGQKIPGAGNKTFTDLVKSACIVESMPLGATEKDLIEYGKVVNGTPTLRTPSKVYKIRPLLRPWGGQFKLHVFDGRLDEAILKTIISYAGLFRGLCDWRPTFGRFELVSIEKVA